MAQDHNKGSARVGIFGVKVDCQAGMGLIGSASAPVKPYSLAPRP